MWNSLDSLNELLDLPQRTKGVWAVLVLHHPTGLRPYPATVAVQATSVPADRCIKVYQASHTNSPSVLPTARHTQEVTILAPQQIQPTDYV